MAAVRADEIATNAIFADASGHNGSSELGVDGVRSDEIGTGAV